MQRMITVRKVLEPHSNFMRIGSSNLELNIQQHYAADAASYLLLFLRPIHRDS